MSHFTEIFVMAGRFKRTLNLRKVRRKNAGNFVTELPRVLGNVYTAVKPKSIIKLYLFFIYVLFYFGVVFTALENMTLIKARWNWTITGGEGRTDHRGHI